MKIIGFLQRLLKAFSSSEDSLEVLSIGRNQIKKLEGLEDVSATLRELWMSYNLIEKLNGIEKVGLRTFFSGRCYKSLDYAVWQLSNLTVLYFSNNLVAKWQEFDRLVSKSSTHPAPCLLMADAGR